MPSSPSESASSSGEEEEFNPLTLEEEAAWESLELRRPVPKSSPPTDEEKAAMKAFKAEKNAFLATLSEVAREYLKGLEAEAREREKEEEKKKAKSGGKAEATNGGSSGAGDGGGKKQKSKEDAGAQAAKQKAAEEKRQAAEEGKQQKAKLAEARKQRKPIEIICKWLQIRGAYMEDGGEAFFEIKLPKWLLARDAFLEEYDLDEGPVMLDMSEMEDMIMGAIGELAELYFGPEYEVDHDLEHFVERAQSTTVIGKKGNLPPWLAHMTYPQTPEEVALTLGDVVVEGDD